MADGRDYDSTRGGWKPCFTRPLNDWELEEVDHFLIRIQGKKVHGGQEDRVMW